MKDKETENTVADICFRIGVSQWISSQRFNELLEFLKNYKQAADEITFFTGETHTPLPLDQIKRRAELLKIRMQQARRIGFRAGINILSTIGHHTENIHHSFSGDYQFVTDINGQTCPGVFCMADLNYRQDYVKPVYTWLVEAEPDYIWIDDDVRLAGHSPVLYTCFCDNCLRRFAEETGNAYTREQLKIEFAHESKARALQLRKAWIKHNRQLSIDFLSYIEKVVHAAEQSMPLGFMDGSRFYEGFPMKQWTDALAGPGKADVIWRPGGGNYQETCLDEVMVKAHRLGMEAAWLPDCVTSIQSELESFSYERLAKSIQYTTLESAAYIAAGCTGTAYNILSMYDEPLDEYHHLVKRLADIRPFLDRLADTFQRIRPRGIFTGWNQDIFAAKNLGKDGWLTTPGAIPGIGHADTLFHIGLPPAYRLQDAAVTTLTGDAVLVLSDKEIRQALTSGAYMDGPALQCLNDRGFGELTGFAIQNQRTADSIQQLLDHPLNGSFVNRCRDGRQSFWNTPAYAMQPTQPGAQPIAKLVDYSCSTVASCTTGVFENKLKGRICVNGYFPWFKLQNLAMTSQMKSIFRWLSNDTLPAYISSYHRINIWHRTLDNGSQAAALVTCYLDPAENVTLNLLSNRTRITLTDIDNQQIKITADQTDGPYQQYKLPSLNPWHIYLLNEE